MTNALNDIRDIKGVVPVPHAWWWLGIVLVFAALAIWLWLRKKPTALSPPVAPAPTPVEIALAALQALRSENPPAEIFFTRVSNIVRQFIEGQFGLHAPERTTEEFLAEASLLPASMELLGAFLQEADLVKFARHRPGPEDIERAGNAAEKFIRESA